MRSNDLPSLEMAPTACPICGAKTVDQAQRKCRANSPDVPTASCLIDSHDDEGNIVLPTAESYAAFEKGFAAFIAQ